MKKVNIKDRGVSRLGFISVLVFDSVQILNKFPQRDFVFTESETSLHILIGVTIGLIVIAT